MPPAKLSLPSRPDAIDCRIRARSTPAGSQKTQANTRSSVPTARPPSSSRTAGDGLRARAWIVASVIRPPSGCSPAAARRSTGTCGAACDRAQAAGSGRQRVGFVLRVARLGRGAAEGLLERTAERALAFEPEGFGDLADRRPRVAHQRPRMLQAQPGRVFGRRLAEHIAMDPDQVPGGI